MTIAESIAQACSRIHAATDAAGRSDSVALEIAVKTRTATECYEAASCLAQLGEPIILGHNRVQEARETAETIRQVLGARIHLIGPLQTNKVNHALGCVDLVESIDSPKIIRALDTRTQRTLPVFIQVNVSEEDTKHGCLPEQVPEFVAHIAESMHLTLQGFMTVGLNSTDEVAVRRAYARLRDIRERTSRTLALQEEALELSMGMSRDLEWAIGEGATIVRLGTAIFGPRTPA